MPPTTKSRGKTPHLFNQQTRQIRAQLLKFEEEAAALWASLRMDEFEPRIEWTMPAGESQLFAMPARSVSPPLRPIEKTTPAARPQAAPSALSSSRAIEQPAEQPAKRRKLVPVGSLDDIAPLAVTTTRLSTISRPPSETPTAKPLATEPAVARVVSNTAAPKDATGKRDAAVEPGDSGSHAKETVLGFPFKEVAGSAGSRIQEMMRSNDTAPMGSVTK